MTSGRGRDRRNLPLVKEVIPADAMPMVDGLCAQVSYVDFGLACGLQTTLVLSYAIGFIGRKDSWGIGRKNFQSIDLLEGDEVALVATL